MRRSEVSVRVFACLMKCMIKVWDTRYVEFERYGVNIIPLLDLFALRNSTA
jgi:hypothetical protein